MCACMCVRVSNPCTPNCNAANVAGAACRSGCYTASTRPSAAIVAGFIAPAVNLLPVLLARSGCYNAPTRPTAVTVAGYISSS